MCVVRSKDGEMLLAHEPLGLSGGYWLPAGHDVHHFVATHAPLEMQTKNVTRHTSHHTISPQAVSTTVKTSFLQAYVPQPLTLVLRLSFKDNRSARLLKRPGCMYVLPPSINRGFLSPFDFVPCSHGGTAEYSNGYAGEVGGIAGHVSCGCGGRGEGGGQDSA